MLKLRYLILHITNLRLLLVHHFGDSSSPFYVCYGCLFVQGQGLSLMVDVQDAMLIMLSEVLFVGVLIVLIVLIFTVFLIGVLVGLAPPNFVNIVRNLCNSFCNQLDLLCLGVCLCVQLIRDCFSIFGVLSRKKEKLIALFTLGIERK